MKPLVGLSLTLGFSLALTVACGKKSSTQSTEPQPNMPSTQGPTLTTPAAEKPSSGSTTVVETANGIPLNPLSPNTPSIPNSPSVITPDPAAGTISNSPVVVQPAIPVESALRGVWGISLAQKPRNCSSIYDFRGDKVLSIHLLCPGDNGKSLALQTETYALISDDGSAASYASSASSCGAITEAKTLTFGYKVSTRDQKKYLQLTEARGPSPELLNIPESSLAGDLKTAATLYDRPVKRGCFIAGVLSRFEVKGAN
jgi:hypothetical protein